MVGKNTYYILMVAAIMIRLWSDCATEWVSNWFIKNGCPIFRHEIEDYQIRISGKYEHSYNYYFTIIQLMSNIKRKRKRNVSFKTFVIRE